MERVVPNHSPEYREDPRHVTVLVTSGLGFCQGIQALALVCMLFSFSRRCFSTV